MNLGMNYSSERGRFGFFWHDFRDKSLGTTGYSANSAPSFSFKTIINGYGVSYSIIGRLGSR